MRRLLSRTILPPVTWPVRSMLRNNNKAFIFVTATDLNTERTFTLLSVFQAWGSKSAFYPPAYHYDAEELCHQNAGEIFIVEKNKPKATLTTPQHDCKLKISKLVTERERTCVLKRSEVLRSGPEVAENRGQFSGLFRHRKQRSKTQHLSHPSRFTESSARAIFEHRISCLEPLWLLGLTKKVLQHYVI